MHTNPVIQLLSSPMISSSPTRKRNTMRNDDDDDGGQLGHMQPDSYHVNDYTLPSGLVVYGLPGNYNISAKYTSLKICVPSSYDILQQDCEWVLYWWAKA
jgi:hypothetical protein